MGFRSVKYNRENGGKLRAGFIGLRSQRGCQRGKDVFNIGLFKLRNSSRDKFDLFF